MKQRTLTLNIALQQLVVLEEQHILCSYVVSTAKKGVGEIYGSEQTPRGKHLIRAKIGAGLPINTVFVARRATGEVFSPTMRVQYPERDWILTRILWLSGLEVGKNRLGRCDTMRRYIYIHGTPDDVVMGVPGSHGCIRMRNQDIIELFEIITVGSTLNIE